MHFDENGKETIICNTVMVLTAAKTSVAQKYIEKYRTYFDHIAYISVILPPDQEALSDADFLDKIMQGFRLAKTNQRSLVRREMATGITKIMMGFCRNEG